MPPNTTELIRHSINVLPNTSVAPSISFCPKRIEEIVAPPAEISTQKATTRFISGNVMAKPEIAIAPTPCPIKILSIML